MLYHDDAIQYCRFHHKGYSFCWLGPGFFCTSLQKSKWQTRNRDCAKRCGALAGGAYELKLVKLTQDVFLDEGIHSTSEMGNKGWVKSCDTDMRSSESGSFAGAAASRAS